MMRNINDDIAAIDQFAQLVAERVGVLAQGKDRVKIVEVANRALLEARAALSVGSSAPSDSLPVARIRAADVVAQKLVALSPATLYRAVEAGRFYCVMPMGRSIGKEFPVWQFSAPVPELIGPVLLALAGQPSSDIHAFWVSARDELNELSPAEVLAGKPFASRGVLHSSQRALMRLPTAQRLGKVHEAAAVHIRGMADIVS